MKRLTGRRDGHTYIVGCPDFALPTIAGLIIQQAVDRLAAYEDTGLEPEDIICALHELNAYKELGPVDRLRELAVVPLCRVGDTVYTFSQMRDKRILPFIKEYEITSIRVKKRSLLYYHEMDGLLKIFKQSDFGKTVFLTRAAAEDALRREQE